MSTRGGRGQRGARVRAAQAARDRTRAVPPQCGQASVELVSLVPLVLAVGLVAGQLLAVGYSSVLAGNAAEAGALALAGGGDARAAVKEALPGWSRTRVSVRGGEVRVELRPPTLLRALSGELEVSAEAAVEAP
jgi:hypothetical protein